MDQSAEFRAIFDARPGRDNADTRLRIRDANLIADIKAQLAGLAAEDDRARDAGWRIAFSPVRTDRLTERSLFEVTLASERLGTRRMSLRVADSFVQMGDGAMQSSVRDGRNLPDALAIAFRRIALRPTAVLPSTVPAGP